MSQNQVSFSWFKSEEIYHFSLSMGFPDSSVVKEYACQCGQPGFDLWGWEDPLEKGKATHSNILA